MFLTHVIAVRTLSTPEYGEFSSAIALVGIVGVGASAVQAITVKRVKGATVLILPRSRVAVDLVALGLVATSIGLMSYLIIGVPVATSMLLAIWVPAAVALARANGEIQGRELLILLHGGTTLVAAVVLGVSGGLSRIAPTVEIFLVGRLVITVMFAFVLLRSVDVSPLNGVRFVSRGLIHSTAVVTSMWFAANLNVLMGRVALDEESAGQIAVAAMLVNSVLLMPSLIASAVYPRAVRMMRDERGLARLLVLSGTLAAGIQIMVALLLLLTKGFLIDWLAGSQYTEAEQLVFPLALAYVPLGTCIVVSQFLLAIGRLLDGLAFVGLVGLTAFIAVNGATDAQSFVQSLQAAASFLLAGLLFQVLLMMRKSRGQI